MLSFFRNTKGGGKFHIVCGHDDNYSLCGTRQREGAEIAGVFVLHLRDLCKLCVKDELWIKQDKAKRTVKDPEIIAKLNFLQTPLEKSELVHCVRAYNCLKSSGCNTIEDIVCMYENQLLKTPRLGRKTLNLITEFLNENGFDFDMEEQVKLLKKGIKL